MSELLYAKVAGITKENPDGQSRQHLVSKHAFEGCTVTLVREPQNQYDSNAILVTIPKKGSKTGEMVEIGYVDKENAAYIAPKIDNGQVVECQIRHLTGGTNGHNIGINLDITVYNIRESKEIKASPPPPQEEKQEEDFFSKIFHKIFK
jgi:single-stranded-DNA-specific exonuclease